jgi:hypothetical protein
MLPIAQVHPLASEDFENGQQHEQVIEEEGTEQESEEIEDLPVGFHLVRRPNFIYCSTTGCFRNKNNETHFNLEAVMNNVFPLMFADGWGRGICINAESNRLTIVLTTRNDFTTTMRRFGHSPRITLDCEGRYSGMGPFDKLYAGVSCIRALLWTY